MTTNFVSECCLRPILTGTKMEYPLGGSTYGIAYTVEYCSCCGKEVDGVVEVTECCGEQVCTCIDDAFEELRRMSI